MVSGGVGLGGDEDSGSNVVTGEELGEGERGGKGYVVLGGRILYQP